MAGMLMMLDNEYKITLGTVLKTMKDVGFFLKRLEDYDARERCQACRGT